jgi:hypothetical protein
MKRVFFGYEDMQVVIIVDDALNDNLAPVDYAEVAVEGFEKLNFLL